MTTPCERARELHAHLLLLRRRKDVDDAVDGARRALRVQRREHEVAGLGGGERGRDRLEVAHLAEEDHVGVLAQRRAQRLAEGRCVGADLALGDDAALVPVHELDRVFDGEDVMRLLRLTSSTIEASVVDLPEPVGPVTRTRPRGRIASSRRDGGSPSSSSVRSSSGIRPERGAERVALEVDVHAKAREAGNAVREVELPFTSSCFCCSVERIR